jgi:hypothetical protein
VTPLSGLAYGIHPFLHLEQKIRVKIFVVFVVLLFCIASTQAQQVYHAYETGIESYTKKTGWFNDKSLPVDLTIRVQNTILTIEDDKQDKYTLQHVLPVDSGPKIPSISGWAALDQHEKDAISS